MVEFLVLSVFRTLSWLEHKELQASYRRSNQSNFDWAYDDRDYATKARLFYGDDQY